MTARSEGSSPPPPCSETENVVGCETVVRAYLLGLGSVGTTLLILQVSTCFVHALYRCFHFHLLQRCNDSWNDCEGFSSSCMSLVSATQLLFFYENCRIASQFP